MAKRNTNSSSGANNANAKGKKQASALEKARRQSVATSARKKQQKSGSRKSFWKGVRHEMSKVVWPTKKELGTYTVVVIATCAVFALGFWLIDTGVLAVMKYVLGIALS